MRKTESIASAAAIVASFSILSRFIGFIRDRILAGQFGASDTLDVYFAAFRVPDLLFQLIVAGALSASFIPLFTKYYHKEKKDSAWKFTNNTLNIIAIGFGVVTLIACIFAFPFSTLIAPGFSPEKQMAVAQMSRIMFGAQFFLAISMVFGSALQGAKQFFLYSLAPIFYNVGIIVGVLVFVPAIGEIGLAWGVMLGALLHLVLQLIGVTYLGYTYKPLILWNSDTKYLARHMLPRVFGLAVNQVNFIAMTILASSLAIGSVTILQFAYNLNFFPIGVVAVSYAIAAFPTLSEHFANNKTEQFAKSFSSVARQILLFMIPATIGFILLRAQIVRIVVGAGAFDWEATMMTANTLGFFAVSFFAQGMIFLLVRGYFASNDTLTPFVVGLGTAVLNIVCALLLIEEFGVMGFGMAYSLSSILQMAMLWVPLRHRFGGFKEKEILYSLGILSIAGLAMAIVMQIVKTVLGTWFDLSQFYEVFLQAVISGIIGLVVYALCALFLKSTEMREFINGLQKRLLKKARVEEEIVTGIHSP